MDIVSHILQSYLGSFFHTLSNIKMHIIFGLLKFNAYNYWLARMKFRGNSYY